MSTEPVRLAVVGSTQYDKDTAAAVEARVYIEEAIENLGPSVVISGGAVGIDSLAATIAREHGIQVIEHLPKHRRWAPDGFKDRNLLIAQDCTHLLCIRHPETKTYGSGWTADRAAEMGKRVERHVVGAPELDATQYHPEHEDTTRFVTQHNENTHHSLVEPLTKDPSE